MCKLSKVECIGLALVVVAAMALPGLADESLQIELQEDRAADWQLRDGDWCFGDGELEQQDFLRGSAAILNEPVFADFRMSVEFNIRPLGDGVRAAAVIFRATGTRTFYWLHFDSESSCAILVLSRPGKSWNGIARKSAAVVQDNWHKLTLTCRGPQIDVALDGQPVLAVEDKTLASGRIGLGTSQGRVAFRNLQIEGEPVPAAGPLADEPLPYQIISRGEAAGTYQAFPDVCRLPDGDLLCVFYAGYGHVSLPNETWPRGGRICAVRSSDEGRTWSEPQVLFDGPQDDRDPHIAATRDGTLWCSFFQYRVVEGKTEFDTCLVRSRDGGKTWDTEPRVLAANRWAVSAPLRELSVGTLVLGAYTANDSTAHGAVLRSTDGGDTWSEPVAIDPDSPVRLDAETDVVQLSDGRLLAALRGDRVNMHYATSPDLGLTWSKVSDIGFAGHCPHLTRLSSGEILLTHRLPNTALHISRDDGASWQGPFEIDAVIGAYASTVELKDHTVLVVYYEEGDASAIRAARFRVTADGIEQIGWK
ncbi:MAG: exo-alpha-sialidase [Pirellulales bacterium]